ncbi:MAG: M48 family metallopeptidase [Methylophilaceae bacterium]
MSFPADFFDGNSARALPVLVRIAGDTLSFEMAGESLTYKLAYIDVQAKLGKTKRLIDLPNGGRLEAFDISELEAAMPSKTSAFWRGVHYLENHLGWVMLSLVATVLAGWLFLQYGVPILAERVADATSPSIEAKMGEQVLQGLDTKFGYFTPSKIDKARQVSIVAAVNSMCAAFKNCPQYRLEFRESEAIGANAFALPGGIMVITDDLIKLSKNDTEIVAVLAHELGHVKKRHAFRQSIQGALSGLILAAVTGDVSSIASGLPGVLMQMRYTRELEYEADAFSLQALKKSCLPPKAFADILLRLAKSRPDLKDDSNKKPKTDTPDAGNPVSDMLSSHPDTLLRIKPFLTAKTDCQV